MSEIKLNAQGIVDFSKSFQTMTRESAEGLDRVIERIGELNQEVSHLSDAENFSFFDTFVSSGEAFKKSVSIVSQYYTDILDAQKKYLAEKRRLDSDLENGSIGIEEYEQGMNALGAEDGIYDEIVSRFEAESEDFKKLCRSLTESSKEALSAKIEQAKELIRSDESGNLSAKDKKQATRALDVSSRMLNQVPDNERWGQTADMFNNVRASIDRVTEGLTGMNEQTEAVLRSASNVAGAAVSMIGAIDKVSKGAVAGISAVEKASLILTVIQAAFQVVTAIFNIFQSQKLKKIEEEKRQYEATVKQIDAELKYNALIRERLEGEKSVTNEKYRQLEQNKKSLEGDAQTLYQQKFQALNESAVYRTTIKGVRGAAKGREEAWEELRWLQALRDSGNDVEWIKANLDAMPARVQELAQSWVSIDDELKEIKRKQEELVADFIGTSADQLTDQWIQALKSGESATYDFGENFKSIMQNAIIQGFSMEHIRPIMERVVEQFSQRAEQYLNGEIGLEDLVDSQMRDSVERAKEDIRKKTETIDYMLDNLGFSLNENEDALTGAIKGVSEETANIIAGQLNAIRIYQAEGIDVAYGQLDVLNRILESQGISAEGFQQSFPEKEVSFPDPDMPYQGQASDLKIAEIVDNQRQSENLIRESIAQLSEIAVNTRWLSSIHKNVETLALGIGNLASKLSISDFYRLK